jgi:hypothetical protein
MILVFADRYRKRGSRSVVPTRCSLELAVTLDGALVIASSRTLARTRPMG